MRYLGWSREARPEGTGREVRKAKDIVNSLVFSPPFFTLGFSGVTLCPVYVTPVPLLHLVLDCHIFHLPKFFDHLYCYFLHIPPVTLPTVNVLPVTLVVSSSCLSFAEMLVLEYHSTWHLYQVTENLQYYIVSAFRLHFFSFCVLLFNRDYLQCFHYIY